MKFIKRFTIVYALKLAPPEETAVTASDNQKNKIEILVIEAIRELIKNQDFASVIKSRISWNCICVLVDLFYR